MERNKKRVVFQVDKELHRLFKIACLKKELDMQDVYAEFMKKYVKENR